MFPPQSGTLRLSTSPSHLFNGSLRRVSARSFGQILRPINSRTTAPPSTLFSHLYPSNTIQLIHLSPFLTGSSSEKLATAQSILSAFKSYGFLYLTAHSIPPSTLTRIFSLSADLFARPLAQKEALAWTTPESNRGYSRMGQEKVSNFEKDDVDEIRKSNPDLKESFEIGREGQEGCPNQWFEKGDAEGEKFKAEMLAFFDQLQELNRVVMSAIALGLGLAETYFDEYTRIGDNTLRLLHYPSVAKSVFERNKGQVRAGEHTDFGSITLLFQDTRGGLQVRGLDGQWLDVEPIEGAIVVNAGDLLARWTNDLIRSTEHRVVEPPLKRKAENGHANGHGKEGGEEMYPARYSIAYFCNPDFDKWIEALPGTWEDVGAKKYKGVNSGDYLVQRLTATY